MAVLALVLSVVGLAGVIVVMCIGVYLAWRKPTPVEPLADGVYKVRLVGYDKLTNTPQYEMDQISVDLSVTSDD